MKQRTRTREAPGRRRYAAGDAVKFRIVLDHGPPQRYASHSYTRLTSGLS